MNRRITITIATLLAAMCAFVFVFVLSPIAPTQSPRAGSSLPITIDDLVAGANGGGSGAADGSGSAVQADAVAETFASEESAAGGADGSASGNASGSTSASDVPTNEAGLPLYEASTVLVALPDGVSADQAVAKIEQQTDLKGVAVETQFDSYAKLSVPGNVSVEEAVDAIEGSGAVRQAQPNYAYYPAEDLASGELMAGSGFDNATSVNPQATSSLNDSERTEWLYQSINAYNAWDKLLPVVDGSTPVTVAVVDTGFNLSNEDLVNTYVAPYNAAADTNGRLLANSANQVAEPTGSGYHGTHVAGLIAATANNEKGIAGVGYNRVKIMPIRAANDAGDMYTDALIRSVQYAQKFAVNNNVRVINMSLGAGRDNLDWSKSDRLLASEIDEARKLDVVEGETGTQGIVTVVAACNQDDDVAEQKTLPFYVFPGDFENVVTVIALGNTGSSDPKAVSRLSTSNYNKPNQMAKDISAPGGDINSTIGSTTNSYGVKSGTSMATPVVSSVFALMLTNNAGLTADEATSKMFSTARDINTQGWDGETGYGEVDASAAVGEAAYLSGPRSLNGGTNGDGATYKLNLPGGAKPNSVTWSIESPSGYSTTTPTITPSGENSLTATVTGGTSGQCIVKAVATVPAQGEGEGATQAQTYTATQTVTVHVADIVGPDTVMYGLSETYKVDYTDRAGTWTWSSTNPTVATIDSATGKLTAEKRGTTTIEATMTIPADGQGEQPTVVTLQKNVEVVPVDLSKITKGSALAEATHAKYTVPIYNGHEQKPVFELKIGNKTLVSGTDYTAEYTNNINASENASVTFTGMGGNYVNNAEFTFKIYQADVANATATLAPNLYYYDGKAKQPVVTVTMGGRALKPNTDYMVSYANNVNIGTAKATITGKGNYKGSKTITYTIKANTSTDAAKAHRVKYRTHVQNVGWQGYVTSGATAGTSGRALRLEGINIDLVDHPYSGGIRYRTHVQNIGWQDWRYNGTMAGTSGRALRLEAIKIELYGDMASHYDVYYRVHAQNVGWMNWAKNGASSGTAGYAYRLEAIQIVLVPKGSAAPRANPSNNTSLAFKAEQVQYRTHVQNVGWQDYVGDGAVAGTSGRSLRLEGINIKLGSESGISGGIRYRTHVQNIGWQGWKYNGAMSGTSGRSLRLEAIRIELTGAAASRYDVYYRVHCQNFGWMGWAKNGASAGSAGYAYRLEAIQIKLVPKGGAAPGSTSGAFRQR